MTKSAIIKLRTTPELKARLTAEVKKRGINESELVRSFIDNGLSEPALEKTSLALETEIHRFTLTLRLPKILFNAAKIKADKKGMTLTKWIESLIKVAITKSTVLSDVEFLAVRESNRNLLAIGRNINQIARGFNSSFQFNIELKLLDDLRKIIDDNSTVIRAFIKASHNTWGEE